MRVWVLALVCFVFAHGNGAAVQLEFYNKHNKMVTVYWEKYGSSPSALGLQRMADLRPGERHTVETNKGHIFEVHESATMTFLALAQATNEDQVFIVDSVRQCGWYGNVVGASSLLPLQTDIAVWRDMIHFSRVAMRLYHSKMYNHPSPEVARQRAQNEARRLHLNKEQPGVHKKFTPFGYEIAQLPETTFQKLRKFWDENRHRMELEQWDDNNHHVNHWEAASYILWLPNDIQFELRKAMKPILEKWVDQELEYTALYGIRVYTNNSYLLNHVDRSATHAVSAIIQVDQRVDEDWLLEVIGHDKKPNYLKLKPGEIALYESATVIHGRETKLNGDYFANVFIHFRPMHNWNAIHL
jgi:hypothetical protein